MRGADVCALRPSSRLRTGRAVPPHGAPRPPPAGKHIIAFAGAFSVRMRRWTGRGGGGFAGLGVSTHEAVGHRLAMDRGWWYTTKLVAVTSLGAPYLVNAMIP